MVTGILRANPGRTDKEPRGCSHFTVEPGEVSVRGVAQGAAAGRLPPRPWSRTFPSPALETYFRRSYLAICNTKMFLKRAESSFCVDLIPAVRPWSQAQPMTYSLSQKCLQTPCRRAITMHTWLCPEPDPQQSLQYHHFRKERENAERRATCTLNSPTSPTTRCLVTRNFSPAVTSYRGRGMPCTLDKINITSEIALTDRLD